MKETERKWIRDIRDGNRGAFEKMFYAYYADLCVFAAQYLVSEHQARDVVQDVFLEIWETRAQWTIHTSLKAYLYQAVRNRALNKGRRSDAKREAEVQIERTGRTVQRRTASDRLQYDELSEAIQRAIAQLPERRRMVFLLHRRHGFTYAEIAEIMDITVQTVETQMGRALKFLRERVRSTSNISS